jgi:hypothetical protein
MKNGTRTINEIGCGLFGVGTERMKDFRVYEEGGAVQVWVDHEEGGVTNLLQYLTPIEAMAFAKAFERCAIAALKNSA